jgi:hypothetical protein
MTLEVGIWHSYTWSSSSPRNYTLVTERIGEGKEPENTQHADAKMSFNQHQAYHSLLPLRSRIGPALTVWTSSDQGVPLKVHQWCWKELKDGKGHVCDFSLGL